MTGLSQQTLNIYALLIGIDGYKPNRLYKNLKGAVRDINLVAGYLLNTLKIPAQRVFKLISPNPEVTEQIESKDPEPTYDNIVAKFKEITAIAQPGEQVYIHYSGHGGRVKTSYPTLKGDKEYDEGIVPMDIGAGGRYLLDVELTTLLKRMTDKGLIVTVVLDSCHSGEATRGDDVAIRGVSEAESTPPARASSVATEEELIENWRNATEEVAGNYELGQWLPQSRYYVFLAACRPSEYAYEYAVNGKERYGALTYWTIDTLTNSFSGLTYKALHDRVSAKIHSKFPSQMPMLSGEYDRFVFGVERGSLQYAVDVVEVLEEEVAPTGSQPQKLPKQVRLNAGMANGLSLGARFAIYTFGATDFTRKEGQLAIAELTKVGASESWGNIVEILRPGKIEQGAQAVMQSVPIALLRKVRLFKKEVGEKENELPEAIAHRQEDALKVVEQALAGNGWLKRAGELESADYQVAVNRQGEYEICIGTTLKALNPALKIEETEAAQKVVQRLVHIAKYQSIEQLRNDNSPLTSCLEVEFLTQPNWQPGMPKNPQLFADPTQIVLKSGEIAFLRIKNISDSNLNIAVLDLQANWSVSRLQLAIPESIYYDFNPDEEILIPCSFTLPEGYRAGQEILKVFATIAPNDFRWLELPALDREIAKKGETLARGDNPLGQLLAAVGGDLDNPPVGFRCSTIFDPSQEWTTKEIQISLQ